MGCSFLRLRGVWLCFFVGLPLTANGASIWRIKGERKPVNVVPSPIWYGFLPLYNKLCPAISPRRRRMTLVSRSRTIYVGNGSLTLGRTRTCTNYIHPPSPYKSFAELFQKRPFPSSPRSPKLYPAVAPRRRRMLPQPLANDLRRERIAHIGTHTDLHKLYPSPIPI